MQQADELLPPPGRRAVDVPLTSTLRAPAEARHAARRALAAWSLPHLADDVSVAVSELVTNALIHGRPPVSLTLLRDDKRLRVDVHDNDPTQPRLPPPLASRIATSGRGLGIVAQIAEHVGCTQIPGDGKVIYATFPVAPAVARM